MQEWSESSFSKICLNICKSSAPKGMTTKLIAVDGPGGAGKSTFAALIARSLNNALIIHTDDFASLDNPLDWWPRLLQQAIIPLSQNQPARYQRYDWLTNSLAEWHVVVPAPFVIIEGVSAMRKAFRPYLTYGIWIETPRAERLRRGLKRDGESARTQWDELMSQEDLYVENENPIEWADVIVSNEIVRVI